MKHSPHAFFTAAVDIASVIMVCLLPLVSGAVFFRLLHMTGTPVWFYVLQGLLFLFGVAQLVFLLFFGLLKALRKKGW